MAASPGAAAAQVTVRSDASRASAERAVMAILDQAAVTDAADTLRQTLLVQGAGGYERPESAYFQRASERQLHIALPGSDRLLLAEEQFIRPHLEEAKLLRSPFQHGAAAARPELRAAVKYVASFDGDGEALADDRYRRLAAFKTVAQSLAPVEDELRPWRSPQATECLDHRAQPATFHAAVVACGYPDRGFAKDQLLGFPCIGNYPDAGIFRRSEQPATKVFEELGHAAHNATVRQRLRDRWRNGRDPQTRADMREISKQTYEHVKSGLEHGPFTEEEMNKTFGAGKWRAMEAFAVHQGTNDDGSAKVRRCENARTAFTNDCLESHDKITTEDPSFPVVVTTLFTEAYAPRRCPPMRHGTDDVSKAYKRMASAHPQATVFAIYDVRSDDVRYFTLPGHNFGLKAAVTSWNRHSTLLAFVARCLFGVCAGSYFDDYDTCEPTWAGSSGKYVLHELHAMLGCPLSDEKDVRMAPANPFLGVITDLRRAAEGLVVVRSKPSRVAKLTIMIEEALELHKLAGRALELCGKLEFITMSACCHRVGRAALSTLRGWLKTRAAHGSQGELTPEVVLALEFFLFLLPRLPPRHIQIGRKERAPLIVYTDAMFKTSTRLGRIGVVIYDPEAAARGEPSYRHASAIVPPDILEVLCPRVQQVTALEALGALAAITTFPEAFRGREVIHFIDNTGAMFNLANGYSGQADIAMISHIFHASCLALGADVWFEWVPSGANIADLPSRDEFELLNELGSVVGEVVWPSLTLGWKAAMEAAFDAYAPRPKRGSKRARAEVALAVSQAKRARAAG